MVVRVVAPDAGRHVGAIRQRDKWVSDHPIGIPFPYLANLAHTDNVRRHGLKVWNDAAGLIPIISDNPIIVPALGRWHPFTWDDRFGRRAKRCAQKLHLGPFTLVCPVVKVLATTDKASCKKAAPRQLYRAGCYLEKLVLV
jgi:hypothetical protein